MPYRAVTRGSHGGWPIATISKVASSVYSPSTRAKHPSVKNPSPGSSYFTMTYSDTDTTQIGWLTNFKKSSSTLPSASSMHSFPSLLWTSIPNSRNLSPARPKSCFVDLSYWNQSSFEDIQRSFTAYGH